MRTAGLAYTLWILSGYIATSKGLSYSFVMISVLLCSFTQGTGAAIMWISQGKYLSNCVLACQERAGLFTSMFWTIVSGSQIFSFLFNSFFLAHFDPKLLFIVDAFISLISMIWIGLLPDPFIP